MRIVFYLFFSLVFLTIMFLVIYICIHDYRIAKKGQIIFGTIRSVKKRFDGKYSVDLVADDFCYRTFVTEDPLIRAYLGKKTRFFIYGRKITKL